MRIAIISTLVFIGFGLTPTVRASSGSFSGTETFTQLNGNCGTGSGARYPCSELNTERPIQRMQLFVLRASNGEKLGETFLQPDGTYQVNWTDNSATGDVDVRLQFRAHHADQNFQVGPGFTGSPELLTLWMWNSGVVKAIANTNKARGSYSLGPDPNANVYDAAQRQWEKFKESTRLNAWFGKSAPQCMPGDSCGSNTIVQITTLGVDPFGTATPQCDNAAAWGNYNWICLPNTNVGHFANLGRVQHEMGHIAEWVSNRSRTRYFNSLDYTYNDPSGTHGYNTEEYASAQLLEAVADHWAHMALFKKAATDPFTCLSTSQCTAANGFNLETPPANCTNEWRWQLSTERYFWDVWDTVVDTSGSLTDNLDASVQHFTNTWDGFPPGTGNAQRDEFNGGMDKQGRSSLDWKNVSTAGGTNTSTQLSMNCAPLTD